MRCVWPSMKNLHRLAFKFKHERCTEYERKHKRKMDSFHKNSLPIIETLTKNCTKFSKAGKFQYTPRNVLINTSYYKTYGKVLKSLEKSQRARYLFLFFLLYNLLFYSYFLLGWTSTGTSSCLLLQLLLCFTA